MRFSCRARSVREAPLPSESGETDEKEIAELDRRLEGEVRRAAEKSQKEYFLREKMKAIKTELGEDDTSGSIEKLQKKIEECKRLGEIE